MPNDCGCQQILTNSCDDAPLEITTVDCSTNVVCKETNWSKCIIYDGPTLGCAITTGTVSGFSYSGSAEDSGTYTTLPIAATGGSGTGATFVVEASGSAVYTVTLSAGGTGYRVGDILTIHGEDIQITFGTASDIRVVVTSLSSTTTTTSTQILNGADLSTVITNLNSRICELTPDFLDYSSFDYSCLRVGGGLTSTGTAIETAKQFAESVSAALCSLYIRSIGTQVSGFTHSQISTLSGTETLNAALGEIVDWADARLDKLDYPLSITASCFTTAPSSTDVMSLWIQWIVDNVCSIRSTINTNVSTQTTRVDNINTYLRGSTTPSYPQTYDISAMGGSATANVHQVLTELIAEVNTLNTTVGALPDLDAITLSWDTCFSSSPYSYTGAAQSLQTHLERFLNVVSREKLTFSADFTVTDSACGKTVELAAGVGTFACSALASCSITDLGDVNSTAPGSGDTGKVYKWNNSATEFQLIALDTFTNIGVVDKTGSYSSESLGLYFKAAAVTAPAKKDYEIGFVEKSWANVSSFQPDYGTSVANPLAAKITWDGNLLLKGKLISVSSPSSNALNVPAGVALFTLPTGFFPSAANNRLDMNVTYTTISPTDTPITLAGYIIISGTTGLVTFYCNDGDSTATAAAIAAFGNNDAHEFTFDGKAVFQ